MLNLLKTVLIKGVFLCRVYKLLNVLEFNSARKRMSVIVENEEGKTVLLCKGADRFVISHLELWIYK